MATKKLPTHKLIENSELKYVAIDNNDGHSKVFADLEDCKKYLLEKYTPTDIQEYVMIWEVSKIMRPQFKNIEFVDAPADQMREFFINL
jgi:hypothetical protein